MATAIHFSAAARLRKVLTTAAHELRKKDLMTDDRAGLRSRGAKIRLGTLHDPRWKVGCASPRRAFGRLSGQYLISEVAVMNSLLAPLAVAVLLMLPTFARAHALGADCKLKDGKVTVETFYDDDSPAIGAMVLVVGGDKKTIAQGKTDSKGAYRFDAPPVGVYEVTVDAGAGHRTRCKLTIPDPKTPSLSENKTSSDPAPATSETIVSDGPGRAEATRFPWQRLLLGLAAIACAAGLWKLATTRR